MAVVAPFWLQNYVEIAKKAQFAEKKEENRC